MTDNFTETLPAAEPVTPAKQSPQVDGFGFPVMSEADLLQLDRAEEAVTPKKGNAKHAPQVDEFGFPVISETDLQQLDRAEEAATPKKSNAKQAVYEVDELDDAKVGLSQPGQADAKQCMCGWNSAHGYCRMLSVTSSNRQLFSCRACDFVQWVDAAASKARSGAKRLAQELGTDDPFQSAVAPSAKKRRADGPRCAVCSIKEPSVVLMPCKHLCLCEDCAFDKKHTECPKCAVFIYERMLVYK